MLDVRFAPKATELLHRREMSRRAINSELMHRSMTGEALSGLNVNQPSLLEQL